MYAKRIDATRKVVAVLFAVFGLGFAISCNLGWESGSIILGCGTLACLVAALGLYIETLVRWWLGVRSNGLKANQFSLAEMLAATVALAVVLGFFRIFGAATVFVLIMVIVLLSCGVEVARRGSADSKGVGLPGGRVERDSTKTK